VLTESTVKVFHAQIDVKGLLLHRDAALRPYRRALVDADGKRCETVEDVRRVLLGCLEAGMLFLPIGVACEGWDYRKGCPGHTKEGL
jgi:hypothetical protein